MQERLDERKVYEILNAVKGTMDTDEFFEKYIHKLYKYAKNLKEFKRMIDENPDLSGFAFDEQGHVKAFNYG